jgi:hypothetical protein
MKIPRDQLAIALKPASDILRAKPTQDSPRYLKVEAAKGKLKLSANDSNQSAVTEVDCEGELDPLCVPFANLQNLMPLFGENVTMDTDKTVLKIRSSGNFSLNTAPVSEFAEIAMDKLKKIAVNPVDLADCIDKVKFASRKDDSRPNLFGVTIRLSAKKISAEASTGIVMAYMEKASIAVDAEFLIPFPFLDNIVTSLRNAGAVLSVSNTKIAVEFDGGCYLCSFLECNPIPSMLRHFEDRKSIGEFTPQKLIPIIRGINNMTMGEEKMCPRVFIESGRLNFQGTQGSVDTKVDKLSKPLKLNASTFIGCLEAFAGEKCKAFLSKDTALIMEQGDLIVATTQLRS